MKRRIFEKAVIAQGLVVSRKLHDYFNILQDKVKKECTDTKGILEEYANIFGVCKETVHKVEKVAKEKNLQDHIEEVKTVNTEKELSNIITGAMATIRKEIDRIKVRIDYEERKDECN